MELAFLERESSFVRKRSARDKRKRKHEKYNPPDNKINFVSQIIPVHSNTLLCILTFELILFIIFSPKSFLDMDIVEPLFTNQTTNETVTRFQKANRENKNRKKFSTRNAVAAAHETAWGKRTRTNISEKTNLKLT